MTSRSATRSRSRPGGPSPSRSAPWCGRSSGRRAPRSWPVVRSLRCSPGPPSPSRGRTARSARSPRSTGRRSTWPCLRLVVVASRRGSGGAMGRRARAGDRRDRAASALTSRLFPDLIGDRGVSSFFPRGTRYLGYPLDYWNGLGIFVGLGFPLLLRAALDARSVARARARHRPPPRRSSATLYLTSSRGGIGDGGARHARLRRAVPRPPARAGRGRAAWAPARGGRVPSWRRDRARRRQPPGRRGSPSQGRSAAALIAGICLLTGARPLARRARRAPAPPGFRVPRLALAAGALAPGGRGGDRGRTRRAPRQLQAAPEQPVRTRVESSPGDRRRSPEAPRLSPTSSHLLSSTGNGRWQFWGAAVDEFETRPLAGRGPGSYEAWWAQHGSVSYFTRHAHSLYLETLGELGAVGLALLLGFLSTASWPPARGCARRRGRDRNVIAALARGRDRIRLRGRDRLDLAAHGGRRWSAIVALALLTGPATATAPASAASRGPLRADRGAARGGSWSSALCLIVAQAIPLLAQDDIRRSQHRFAAAEISTAPATRRSSARSVQPWAASPHLQLALVDERRGRPAKRALGDRRRRSSAIRSTGGCGSRRARIDDESGRAQGGEREARPGDRAEPALAAARLAAEGPALTPSADPATPRSRSSWSRTPSATSSSAASTRYAGTPACRSRRSWSTTRPDDDTRSWVRAAHPEVRVIELDENLGRRGARPRAARVDARPTRSSSTATRP